MKKVTISLSSLVLLSVISVGKPALHAQEIPSEYQPVLTITGKSGDYKANVLKVNVPRNDLHITVNKVVLPTPFGFGGWFAMTKGDGDEDVMMGDLEKYDLEETVLNRWVFTAETPRGRAW